MPVVTCAKAKAQHEKPWIFDGVASQNQWKARHGTTLCSKKRPKKQRHGKRIACHRARQGIAHGKAIKAKTCAKAKAQHEKTWNFDGVASQN